MKCWWCMRDRKTTECRFRYGKKFYNLCDLCRFGFKSKIIEER